MDKDLATISQERWWCVLLVGRREGTWQRAVAIKVKTLVDCLEYRSDNDEFQLAQVVHCTTEHRAIAFLRLWLQYPRICRAPISFAAKAEILARVYKLPLFCDFNVVFDDDTSEFVALPPPPLRTPTVHEADASMQQEPTSAQYPSTQSPLMEVARAMLTYPSRLRFQCTSAHLIEMPGLPENRGTEDAVAM